MAEFRFNSTELVEAVKRRDHWSRSWSHANQRLALQTLRARIDGVQSLQ